MERPVALRLSHGIPINAYPVSVDPEIVQKIKPLSRKYGPAIMIVRDAEIIAGISTGVIDSAGVISVIEGDWSEAILLVVPYLANEKIEPSKKPSLPNSGDARFLASVERDAKNIAPLARQVLSAIRESGVDGELVEKKNGKWVNYPLNSFTLKAQPRVGNLHFTIYGNPDSYNNDGFLLKDQNSYSRGWVRSLDDAYKLAGFVKQSHLRKSR